MKPKATIEPYYIKESEVPTLTITPDNRYDVPDGLYHSVISKSVFIWISNTLPVFIDTQLSNIQPLWATTWKVIPTTQKLTITLEGCEIS
jgi:hypothetical protein